MLPFTRDQFFDVFASYNAALWPASLTAYALAALAILAIIAGWEQRTRIAALVLSLMWAWTGAAYHLSYFAPINSLAYAFGVLFLIQAVLMFQAGVIKATWRLQAWSGWPSAAGWALIAYAAIAYPLIGLMTGHHYDALPQFGVTPCPVTLFTFGLLLLSQRPYPWILMIIPVIWSLIGGSAAFLLSVPQDWLLLASGIISTLIMWRAAKTGGASLPP